MHPLRQLRFETLDDSVQEAERLLRSGYTRHGNWSLGQICRHLSLVQDLSVDGYPRWMSLFAFLRPALRRFLLPKLIRGDSPTGIRTSRVFVPPSDLDDATEVTKFSQSVTRFKAHSGQYQPHPAFGRMSRELLEELHAAHAAHHMRFLESRIAPSSDS